MDGDDRPRRPLAVDPCGVDGLPLEDRRTDRASQTWHVRATERFAVFVTAEGRVLGRVEVEPSPGGEVLRVPVPLRRGGGQVEVAVTLPGWPVGDARLEAVHEPSGARFRRDLDPWTRTATWRTPSLEPGTLRVRLHARRADGPEELDRVDHVEVVEGRVTPVSLAPE